MNSQLSVEQSGGGMNNSEVAVEVDPPIVIETSFNQQQHPVQDIENPNLEEFDGAPPNFVQKQHTVQDNDTNQNWEGKETCDPTESMDRAALEAEGTARQSALDIELMYRAALEGDWEKAEELLEQDPTLAYKEGNYYLPEKETGRKWYRPLHVAIAFKQDKFTLKLIERMGPRELVLEDSYGLTACGYAAAYGKLGIAKAMIKKHPQLLEECVEKCEGLSSLAALSWKGEVVSFFLEQTGEVDPSWKNVWLELLQNVISTKMYGEVLRILEKDGYIATMSNEQGTALHVLARQNISAASTGKLAMIFRSIFGITLEECKTMAMSFLSKIYDKFNNKDINIYDSGRQGEAKMPSDFRSLAAKLLANIREMDERRALKLLNNPPILHDAAKVGNVDLIRMITRAYPCVIWYTDHKGCSLISIAIECREANVFSFIQRFRALDLISFLFKEAGDENNLLHLAAELGPRKNSIPALQMQSELAWYKAVESMIPVDELIEKKNEDGKTPRDLFKEKHEKLLEESKLWMKTTADSCMLIATIILTVVYAAAFTVPGGNSEETGLPILVKSNWLSCFFIFEALALFSSTLCIITFWSITCSGFVEDQFLYVLPYQLRVGFTALFGSLIGAITAFLSAYHMVLVEGKAWLIKYCLLSIYLILVLAICGRFSELWNKTKLPECLPKMISNGNSQGPYGKSKTDENKSHLDPAKAEMDK
ncbi:hypothetical protein C2S51_018471 [Perilla frutescens var. frutescens]|nr:hypothetical protein C2S51_018471 [Perilla frutescens var. frutescens]